VTDEDDDDELELLLEDLEDELLLEDDSDEKLTDEIETADSELLLPVLGEELDELLPLLADSAPLLLETLLPDTVDVDEELSDDGLSDADEDVLEVLLLDRLLDDRLPELSSYRSATSDTRNASGLRGAPHNSGLAAQTRMAGSESWSSRSPISHRRTRSRRLRSVSKL